MGLMQKSLVRTDQISFLAIQYIFLFFLPNMSNICFFKLILIFLSLFTTIKCTEENRNKIRIEFDSNCVDSSCEDFEDIILDEIECLNVTVHHSIMHKKNGSCVFLCKC